MRRVSAPLFIPTLLLAAAIIGLACGGGEEAQTPTSEATRTATLPSPTPEPRPEPTPTDDTAADNIGELTLEEYFQQIDVLQDEGADAVGEARQKYTAAIEEAETEEQMIEAVREFVATIVLATGNFLEEVDSIAPPPAVLDEHNELLAAETAVLEALDDVLQRPPNAQPASELMEELFEGPSAITALAQREAEACDALQAVADENGIDVDVCVDE